MPTTLVRGGTEKCSGGSHSANRAPMDVVIVIIVVGALLADRFVARR